MLSLYALYAIITKFVVSIRKDLRCFADLGEFVVCPMA